jgi:hypothetical protein
MSIIAPEPPSSPGVDGETIVARYARIAHDFEPRPVDIALRAIDMALAATGLVLLAPLLALCGLAVLLSGRPVLYRGARCFACTSSGRCTSAPRNGSGRTSARS